MHDQETYYSASEVSEIKKNASDYLLGVLESLYGPRFDPGKLENCLDELCHALGLKYQFDCALNVESTKNVFIEDWKKFNNNYLRAIA